ncbi:MAG TPA: alpha/beta fold hydrolase [Gemmatimonadaceae bacterium]|nr:alpha/beta fold hydrolase [Gemmatimonadaceae bacterium]
MIVRAATAALLLALTGRAAAAQATAAPMLALAPCALPGLDPAANARCGTLSVIENRTTGRGRTIDLRVVVLPATGPDRAPDPVFFIAGGPGSSIVAQAGGLARHPSGLRERRDFVLVDQRGTGGSAPLDCPFYGPPDSLQSFLGGFMPLEAVRRCRAMFEKERDLAQYTTTVAAQDLDAVRSALGYERINLSGGSYGTRAAQEYIRRYPSRVRAATLFGLVPPSLHMPQHFARDAQMVLDAVVAECAADESCRVAFPRLADEVKAVFGRLRRAPATATVPHPRTGQPTTVSLSYDMVAETLRYMLYQSTGAALVPAAMHAAANGDFTWLANRALRERGALTGNGNFDGVYLAITCMEDVPFTDSTREAAAAKGTFLGEYRMHQQRAACEARRMKPVSREFHTPVRSDVPVLLVTGALDPVTPPRYAAEVSQTFLNSLVVVVPSGGHSLAGLVGIECIHRLQREAIERGGVAGLDTSCVSRVRRAGFPTSLAR